MTDPHYPTLVPVNIADLTVALEALESLDDLDAEETAAIGRLRLVNASAIATQSTARLSHPELALAGEEAGNLHAGPAAGPARHAGGHATEVDAAQAIALIAGNLRELALVELIRAGEDGLTDVQLEERLGVKRPTGGNRRGELVKLGLAAKRLDPETGATITRTVTGHRPSTVWVATETGEAALDTLGYRITRVLDIGGRHVRTMIHRLDGATISPPPGPVAVAVDELEPSAGEELGA